MNSKKGMFCLRQVVFLVLAVLLFCQCGKSTNKDDLESDISFNEASGKRVQITGMIHHRDIYPHTKEVKINIPQASGGRCTQVITVPISDEGTFHFDFELAQPQDVRMETYLDFLYLKPGDSIHIELDFQDLTNAKLSGKPTNTAAINHQFCKYFESTFYRKSDYSIGTDCSLNCSVEEIVDKLNEKRKDNHTQRNLFLQKNKVQDEVKTLTESMIDLDYYVELIQIMQTRGAKNKSIIDPKLLMEELNEQVAKHFGSGLYSDSHFDFIVSAYLLTLQENNDFETDEKTIDWIKRTIPNDTIKNFAFTTIASSALRMKDLDFFQDLYVEIDQEYLLERLMGEYQLIWFGMNNPEFISAGIMEKLNDFTFSSLDETANPLTKFVEQKQGKLWKSAHTEKQKKKPDLQ